MEITKEDLEHLATLSKIELDTSKEDIFLKGFQGILRFFEELQNLKPRPELSLSAQKQPLREDGADLEDHFKNQEKLIESFSERKERYLKVPTVIKDHKDHK